jgi:hypothetical protein
MESRPVRLLLLPPFMRPTGQDPIPRTRVILICGNGDFVRIHEHRAWTVVYARSVQELIARLRIGMIDAAVIEEDPWPGAELLGIARELRAQGIGIVVAARTKTAAERGLREHPTVLLGSPASRSRLGEAIALACFETDLVQATTGELFRSRFTPPATPRVRYIEKAGAFEPSKSTMSYVFGDLELPSPDVPELYPDEWIEERRTVAFTPPAELLASLRAQLEPVAPANHAWRNAGWVVLFSVVIIAVALFWHRFLR